MLLLITWRVPALLFLFLIFNVRNGNLVQASNTQTFFCPSSGFEEVPSGTTVRLAISSGGKLCTLTIIQSNKDGSSIAPVGRSYDSNPWEPVAGPYTTLLYNCDDASCEVTLPQLSGTNQRFRLTSLERNISRKDTVARFFEQATFGTTEGDLRKFDNGKNANLNLSSYFANWTYHQMYEEDTTSHRLFWRQRTNSIYKEGNYGMEGKAPKPCQKGSHWRGYAFSETDVKKTVKIDYINGSFSLNIGGQLRTIVSSFQLEKAILDVHSFPLTLRICWVRPHISGLVTLSYNDKCRVLIGGNPQISIDESTDTLAVIESEDMSETVILENLIDRMILGSVLRSDQCNEVNETTFIQVARPGKVQYLLYEPRLLLKDNFVSYPLYDGGGNVVNEAGGKVVQCSNVARTFLNEDSCRLATNQETCAPEHWIEGSVKLKVENIKKFFEARKYIYAVTRLRLEDDRQVESPCIEGVRSRWRRQSIEECIENIHLETAAIFGELIEDGFDSNPFVNDLYLPQGKTCHEDDLQMTMMTMKVGSECWSTVHPDYLNVYDFSDWAKNHPGNSANPNAIKQFALDGSHALKYPSFHSMNRWRHQKRNFPFLGRLGDWVDFSDFPDTLRNQSIAGLFGLATPTTEDGNKAVICGSPFEGGSKLFDSSFSLTRHPNLDVLSPREFEQQRRTVWTMIATTSPDQLRQRVAWALSQILVVSPSAITFPHQTESFLTFYDIFVRNAFGNYKNVLKEVAYSPMMAEMLTYLNSRSKEYVWKEHREIQYPDENFAREIMQLFSIGLVKLHNDGTPVLDPYDKAIATYNNDEIQEYARVWTGFRRQSQRGNVEMRDSNMNTIDPMAINLKWRDQLPKMGLNRKYIGDQYPLCAELPSNSFLKKNAKYRLLGKGKVSDVQNIPSGIDSLKLERSSQLYTQLCQPKGNGDCSYPGIVFLNNDLNCHGDECFASHPKLINLGNNVHYEHIRSPCVNLSFPRTMKQPIIVDPNGNIAFERNGGANEKNLESLTYFRVTWGASNFPKASNFCGQGACQELSGRCRCEAVVEDTRVFTSLPTRNEVLSQLHIGALPPNMYEYAGYEPYPEFNLHFQSTGQQFGPHAAFEVDDDFGNKIYLKNLKSSIKILDCNDGICDHSSYMFRNPVTFYDEFPEVKDAQYETDAALDQFFYHQNTGPFLALRLIQRFGISNPSPRYIGAVTDAFRTGKYDFNYGSDSFSFGSAKYGDLGAMIAAILMDRESRMVVLDSDLSFGGIREPLIKVIALMRNMGYTETSREFTSLHGLEAKIGQSPFDLPSVFSYYLPEYSPPGVIAKASLVSPESMLLQNSIGLVNGLNSLLTYGLNSCGGGFGGRKRCWRSESLGHLSYSISSLDKGIDVVDDLASILTSGRLSNNHRGFIKHLYSVQQNKTEALKLAQKLIVLSPEFHALGTTREAQKKRPEVVSPTKTCQEYKAVVHILLKGGCDSFNLLVPHSRCTDRDMYDEYKNARGSVAMPKVDLLQINTEDSDQICNTFGIHKSLPIIKRLYDDRDAAFLAGIGVLSEPVTKENYELKTKTTLFAHNTVQAEIGRLDPFVSTGNTATLGRLADVLSSKFNVNGFAVDTTLFSLEGINTEVPRTAVNSNIGFQKFNPSALEDDILNSKFQWINGAHEDTSNFFTQTWSSSLHESIALSERLYDAEKSVTLTSTFPSSKFGQQLELIAKVIASNECRGSSRDIFYVETGNFDHHSYVLSNLEREFDLVNDGLASFVDEMKSLDVWDKVTVVVTSDFGRTLSGNSGGGTDHAWSGINMMLGGSVKGGKIFGKYPDDLSSNNKLDLGRGRLVPTMPFEAPWNAVSQWLGVEDQSDLDKVLPNRNSFPDMLLDLDGTFTSGQGRNSEQCEGKGPVVSCVPMEGNDDDDDDLYYNFDDDVSGEEYQLNAKGNNSTMVIATLVPILIVVLVVGLSYYIKNSKKLKCRDRYFHHKSADKGKDESNDDSKGDESNDDSKDVTFDFSDSSEVSVEHVDDITLYYTESEDGCEAGCGCFC